MKVHSNEQGKLEHLLREDNGCKELLGNVLIPYSDSLADWMKAPYEKNMLYQEQLTVQTGFGGYVRSKSEALIVSVLQMNHIPFRYECALHLGGRIYYPDFTIRHPISGKIYYWEHFGLMDDADYAKKAYAKLQVYNSHGIIPSIHLITTYETKESPLSMKMIEEMIKYYFL